MVAMLEVQHKGIFLLVALSDPAGVGGWHCVPHPERLIANQEFEHTALALDLGLPFLGRNTVQTYQKDDLIIPSGI